MLSQTHTFESDAEVLAFQKRVLRFLTRLENEDPGGAECLFLTNRKTVRRRLVQIEATSHDTLAAFNRFLESDQERMPAMAQAV
ncbi:hypothetical protein [Maricaulis sp.]|uniref:hypothetical protein n=1 Tax=Maricaulis sp. TaxID=1486257 RepID=UPI002617B2DF|nr:hypothetical protein [Maricaulis sp.]